MGIFQQVCYIKGLISATVMILSHKQIYLNTSWSSFLLQVIYLNDLIK